MGPTFSKQAEPPFDDVLKQLNNGILIFKNTFLSTVVQLINYSIGTKYEV